jgi:ssDNA-binding Zn-finger/Zn-ribbon topoisomerase 1
MVTEPRSFQGDARMTLKYELALFDNAHDFLIAAIENVRDGSDGRSWKYALIHLASSIELLMKQLLLEEHWSLLFENIKEAKEEDLKKGNFKSITFASSLSLLENIASIKLGYKDKRYLNNIQTTRNRIMHFSCDLNLEETKSQVARGINIFLNLLKKSDKYEKDIETSISQELVLFDKFVKDRLNSIKPDLDKAQKLVSLYASCPACTQETLIVPDDAKATETDSVECLFCRERFTCEEIAESGDGPGGPCPECDSGFLGFIVLGNEDGEFVCPICGFRTQRTLNIHCDWCGDFFWSEDGSDLCLRCLQAKEKAEVGLD